MCSPRQLPRKYCAGITILCLCLLVCGCSESASDSNFVSREASQQNRETKLTTPQQGEAISSPIVPTATPQLFSTTPLPPELLLSFDRGRLNAAEHNERGMTALQREDWKLAAEEFQAGLEVDPDRADLSYGLAMSRFRMKDFGGAAALLDRLITRNPDDSASLELLGIVELHQRRHVSSIRHLTKAIDAGRTGPTIFAMRAQSHFENAEFVAAFADTDLAIEAGMNDAGVYLLRCASAIRLQRVSDAREALQQAEKRGAQSTAIESLAVALAKLAP